MEFSNSSWDWPEFGIDLLFQIGLLAAVFTLSVWLWPEGVLDTPVSMIALGDWLWAGGAVGVGALGLLMAYFVLVEPVVALVKGLRAR